MAEIDSNKYVTEQEIVTEQELVTKQEIVTEQELVTKQEKKEETIVDIAYKIYNSIDTVKKNIKKINRLAKKYKIEEKIIEEFGLLDDAKNAVTDLGNKAKDGLEGMGNDLINEVKNVVKKPFDEIKNFFESIPKLIQPLLDFIENIKDFFKKIIAAFDFSDFNKIKAVIATLVIPFIGQLYARLFYLDGSLHLPFLLLFSLPPLSIIPALAIMFNLIEKAKGGKPWDGSIILPIVLNALSNLILPYFLNGFYLLIVQYVVVFVSLIIIYYIKGEKECNNKSAPLLKVLRNALISKIAFFVLPFAIPYIPYIGLIFKFVSMIPYAGQIIMEGVSLLIVYVLLNMVNGSDNSFCQDNNKNIYMIFILFIISIVLTYVSTII